MNLLWKTTWKFLKLKIELPFDSAIPFLGIYQERIRTIILKRYMVEKEMATHSRTLA